MVSTGARAYIMGLGRRSSGGPAGRAPGGGSGGFPLPSEAESSVAFEAPAEESNLTLVPDSFFSVHIEM